jgi:hypothetical protein
VRTIAIELNDAGILALDETGLLAPASPGYALVDGGALRTGTDALDRARLKPRQVNNRFWDRLDTTPLSPPFPDGLSDADLAHTHLKQLWDSLQSAAGGVILAVPGWRSDAQLGLALGIARSCQIPVTGLIDAGLAACARGYPGHTLLHVDLELHRTVLTELEQDQEIVRRRVEVTQHAGLVSLHEAWVKLIAETFIQRTRFDPLHAAATEQQLYHRLPHWLELLRGGESAVVAMKAAGKEHSVELTRQQAVAAVNPLYEHILQLVGLLKRAGEPATVLLSHRMAELPGLEARISELQDTEIVTLPAAAAADGALCHAEDLESRDETLPFVTRIPRTSRRIEQLVPRSRPKPAPALPKMPPTHILHNGLAYPLTRQPFVVGVSIPDQGRGINLTGPIAGISRSHCSVYRAGKRVVVEDQSSYGTFLNGQRIEGKARLAAGDRLRLGSPGIELQLIAVAKSDETSKP